MTAYAIKASKIIICFAKQLVKYQGLRFQG